MIKNILFTFALAIFQCTNAQNLVLNPSFEQHIFCPVGNADFGEVIDWSSPNPTTPDYYHQCSTSSLSDVPNNYAGHQQAFDGQGYAGILLYQPSIPNIREYIQGQFSSPLLANTTYHFKMYVNCANQSRYITNSLGVYFSASQVSNSNYTQLQLTAQFQNSLANMLDDSLNWNLISFNYTAQGGENYFVIGNFYSDLYTIAGQFNASGTVNCAMIYIDQVSMDIATGIDESGNRQISNLYFDASNQKIKLLNNNASTVELTLFDMSQKKVFTKQCIGNFELETTMLAKGIYVYEMKDKHGFLKRGKLCIY